MHRQKHHQGANTPSFSPMAILTTALLLLSATPCHAFPTATQRIDEVPPSPLSLNSTESCSFTGNPNLYGLGIRTGIYLTSLATILASVFEQRSAIELCKVSGLFQLAVFIALVYQTIANARFYAVEALVTYLFCLSSLAVSFGDPTGTDKHYFPNYLEKRTLPNLVSLLRQLVILAVEVYQAWFWFLGVDTLQRLPCGTDTFFLARVDAYGPFRMFAKVWSILITMGLATVIAFRMLKCPLQRAVPKRFKVVIGGLVLGLIVAAVELTLRWNDVRGVNDVTSAGQLIPLLVGGGTLVGMVLNWEKRGL